jgi:hypothetical protein
MLIAVTLRYSDIERKKKNQSFPVTWQTKISNTVVSTKYVAGTLVSTVDGTYLPFSHGVDGLSAHLNLIGWVLLVKGLYRSQYF